MPYRVLVFLLACSVHTAVQAAFLQHPGLLGQGGTIYKTLDHPTSIILPCLGIFFSYWPFSYVLLFPVLCFYGLCVCVYVCVSLCRCVSSVFSPLCLFLKRKRKKGHGVLFCEWDGREHLREVGGVENIIKNILY